MEGFFILEYCYNCIVWRFPMNVKKSLSLIAFAYFFTLVNLNLQSNGTSINIFPDFIGWILFFLAHDKLGSYMDGKKYMKWTALVMVVVTAVIWVLDTFNPEMGIDLLKSAAAVVSVVYMFILFGVLEKVAGDLHSQRQQTIGMLKILNVVLYAAFIVVAILSAVYQNESLALVSAVIGLAALVSAIFTAVVLFLLRKEANEKEISE